MKTETNVPHHIQAELKGLKFSNAEIYPFTCDVKGEPVVNIDSDKMSFTILFPTNTSIEKATLYADLIVKAVNMHDELVEIAKGILSGKSFIELSKRAEQLLKQAESK